ncbi:Histone acetyltransferase [Orbilia oligospora]|nr:Histone acetyltransferase [Orbilia oligospora]
MVARDGSQEPTVEKEVITGFATIATLAIGVKAWVEKDGEPRKAEILSKTTRKGEPVFYVHYQDFNKRLDEWVAASRIDITREVEFPVPEKPTPPKKEQSYPNLKNQKKDKKLPRDSIASTPDPTAGPSTPSASTSRPLKRNRVTFEAEHASPQSFAATPAPDDDGIDLVETPAGNVISAPQTDPTIGINGEVEGFSKEKEIEKLRTSGSMTQSAHEVARVRNLSKLQIGKYEVETCYELSKREGKLGSPEKPLSDLGLLGYRAFWQEVIVDLLVEVKENKGEISVDEIAARLAMTANDVVHTLQNLNMIKYFKGQHVICLTAGVIAQRDALLEKQKVKGKRTIDSSLLKWKPPVFLAAAKTWNW